MVKLFSALSVTVTAVVVVASWLCVDADVEAAVDSDDPFEIQCDGMKPSHLNSTASEAPCPFYMDLMTIAVQPGILVNMSLVSIDQRTPFKAFMVQVRDQRGDRAIGSFMPTCEGHENWMNHHAINCTNGDDQNNTLIKSNDEPKISDVITWLSPVTLNGNITIRYSVIQDEKNYWINQEIRDISVHQLYSNAYYKLKTFMITFKPDWYMEKYNHINCFGNYES